MKNILIVFVTAFLLSGMLSCKKKNFSSETRQQFTLRYSQTVEIKDAPSGESFLMKFNKVAEDSRCPDGAMCFWAGNVILELLLDKNEKIRISPIIVTSPSPATSDTSGIMVYKNFRIKLLDVKPVRDVQSRYSDQDYRGTFVVER